MKHESMIAEQEVTTANGYEESLDMRLFSEAEKKHLKAKALAANTAVSAYNEFLTFLREQHGAVGEEWQLGEKGFLRA